MATDGGRRAERPAGASGKAKDAAGKGDSSAKDNPPKDNPPKDNSPRAATATDKGRGDGEARIPYEDARDQLTELVKRLEAGGLTLEQSLELWERGELLAAICEDWLEGARARLAAATAQRTDDEPGRGGRAAGRTASDPAAPGAPF